MTILHDSQVMALSEHFFSFKHPKNYVHIYDLISILSISQPGNLGNTFSAIYSQPLMLCSINLDHLFQDYLSGVAVN